MMLKDAIHEAEECGYWAEVPSTLDCATQDETFEELLGNLYDGGRRLSTCGCRRGCCFRIGWSDC